MYIIFSQISHEIHLGSKSKLKMQIQCFKKELYIDGKFDDPSATIGRCTCKLFFKWEGEFSYALLEKSL